MYCPRVKLYSLLRTHFNKKYAANGSAKKYQTQNSNAIEYIKKKQSTLHITASVPTYQRAVHE